MLFSLVGHHPATPIVYFITLATIAFLFPDRRHIAIYAILVMFISLATWNTFIAVYNFDSKMPKIIEQIKNILGGNTAIKNIGKSDTQTHENVLATAIVRRYTTYGTEATAFIYVLFNSLYLLIKNIKKHDLIKLLDNISKEIVKIIYEKDYRKKKLSKKSLYETAKSILNSLLNKKYIQDILWDARFLIVGYSQFVIAFMPGYGFEGMLRGVMFSLSYIIRYTAGFLNGILRHPILMLVILIISIPAHVFLHYSIAYLTNPSKSGVDSELFIYSNIVSKNSDENYVYVSAAFNNVFEYQYTEKFVKRFELRTMRDWYLLYVDSYDFFQSCTFAYGVAYYRNRLGAYNTAMYYSEQKFNRVYTSSNYTFVYVNPQVDRENDFIQELIYKLKNGES